MPKLPPSEEPRNGPEPPPPPGQARQHEGRPPACHRCAQPSWWNGWRLIFPVVVDAADGALRRVECWLEKAKCSSCELGFCIYPPGHYPRRQYQLDPVAKVVAAEAMAEPPGAQAEPPPGAQVEPPPGAQAERPISASRTSRRRWCRWIAELGDPARLWAMAVRLDPDTPLGSGLASAEPPGSVRARAAQVLSALEGLGEALVRLGLGLGSRYGLGRVLGWQYAAHGDIYSPTVEPTQFSPAMAI